ncbi:unnamed protein product (macronuclear) [Paramecium tetraurelia]|uniref:Trichohyalin-plectin-homology domain-containing protein n=1 Tax=Paramecium tetraurelia TaxID=5888 RepID=A0D905_PARTE|nr:uncharacterized protein GSPATT00014468001 [Paramecium tetraurelia]CAK79522.1 unnamed protein product [Paramecium tetraurelia]|eukprot:XP_001446919.1 hypothetical protein (macronuclear) [Paramecium tetraurelia strain d4-2]
MNNSEKSKSVRSGSARVRSAIERAGLLQQREQLREMLISKFSKDYAQGNKNKELLIQQIVNEYFTNEQVTENSLKQLKARVIEVVQKQKALSQTQHISQNNNNSHVDNKSEQKSQIPRPQSVRNSAKSEVDQDQYSVTSSEFEKQPKSVYVVDEEDEWAALVKFDTELYTKEQQLEQQRQAEFKKKMKTELDRQLAEKKRRLEMEKKQEEAYVKLRDFQMNVYDQREEQKKREIAQKQQMEKEQRDRQVREEEKRKYLEKKKQSELDAILVQRIQEELKQEQRETLQKKEMEKRKFIEMMDENEKNRCKQIQDEQTDKQLEVDMQRNWKKSEKWRKKEREDKIKKIMSDFSQTVVKNQKDQIKAEDDKMMKAILMQNEIEQQDEEMKKRQIKSQQLEMRKYLTQVNGGQERLKEEEELNKKQAQVWQQDLQTFQKHEKSKYDYIKDVNAKHQEILKQQIDEKKSQQRPRNKMNNEELMHNKPLLRELADKQDTIKVRKINIG